MVVVVVISFKSFFYVSLGNNFFTVFCGDPLVVEAPGQWATSQFAPPLKYGPASRNFKRSRDPN